MQTLLVEVTVSCLSKYMFPLDDLGHSQHHIHSIHLFYTGISHTTRKKKKDKHRSVGSTLLQSSVFCVYAWGERMMGPINPGQHLFENKIVMLYIRPCIPLCSTNTKELSKHILCQVSTLNTEEQE